MIDHDGTVGGMITCIQVLRAKLDAAAAEAEKLRVQLAGCSAAALGYAEDVTPEDYGYSASLDDCRRTYRDLIAATTRVARLEAAIRRFVKEDAKPFDGACPCPSCDFHRVLRGERGSDG